MSSVLCSLLVGVWGEWLLSRGDGVPNKASSYSLARSTWNLNYKNQKLKACRVQDEQQEECKKRVDLTSTHMVSVFQAKAIAARFASQPVSQTAKLLVTKSDKTTRRMHLILTRNDPLSQLFLPCPYVPSRRFPRLVTHQKGKC